VYFPQDAALVVEREKLLGVLLKSLNEDPGAYDDNLADAKALAAKLGIALSPGDIPERITAAEARQSWGPAPGPDGAVSQWIINGDLAGLRHIADAARLVDAVLTPLALVS
jgi:hypothetical protein